MSKTAVEWLIDQMKQRENQGMSLSMYELEMFGEKAKEMEKEQIIDACISTTQDCYRAVMEEFNQPIVFTNEDLQNQKYEAEQYYNETFKSK